MTTLADRPHSLPVATTISITYMERLRNVGHNDSNSDALDKENDEENDGTADLPLTEPVDGGKGGAISPNTSTNMETSDVLQPIIQEHPATPRKPIQASDGGGGGRVRPASL